ncbi:sugar transferase-like protein [Natronococcus pandeyae]|uniref:Sugar transferase-like protein n=1 Tax=Natronococcus pandeyae TaxID=2055836 RepID=A0A8J8TSR5_9EURY|nr:glycosyltransferase [Natronococcus pandeyae]TYL39054.1 sugar transferase-like protein [Natronococcus pandeyae]
MAENDEPFVSVIIPVYNDPDGIETTLAAVVNQTYDEYEVLPVDNASTDNTKTVIDQFATRHSELIHPLEETDVQSSYAARNRGIKAATGSVFAFLDSDMSVDRTWLEDAINAFETRSCDYMGYQVNVITDEESPTVWERYEQTFSFPIKTYLEDKNFAPTCALVIRADVITSAGPFDERLVSGGDKEFGQRVHRAGFTQCYADDVATYHPARDSWDALQSKALRIGRGRAQMRRYHPELGGYFHPIHPINYLPPSPFRLSRRFSGRDMSLLSLIGFYLLEYILKLTQTYGTLRESISLHRSEREEQ